VVNWSTKFLCMANNAVQDAMKSVRAQFRSIVGERAAARLRTNSGRQFLSKAMGEVLNERDNYPTTTGCYDPTACGRAV